MISSSCQLYNNVYVGAISVDVTFIYVYIKVIINDIAILRQQFYNVLFI